MKERGREGGGEGGRERGLCRCLICELCGQGCDWVNVAVDENEFVNER